MMNFVSRSVADVEEVSASEAQRIVGRFEPESVNTECKRGASVWHRGTEQPCRLAVLHGPHAERGQSVWAYSVLRGRMKEWGTFFVITVIDAGSGTCLTSRIEWNFHPNCMLNVLAELMDAHGAPDRIRAEWGSVDVAAAVRRWLGSRRGKTRLLEVGYRNEREHARGPNGYLRAWLKEAVFQTPQEAQRLIRDWTVRNAQAPVGRA